MINTNYSNPKSKFKKVILLTSAVAATGTILYLVKNKGLKKDIFEKSKNAISSQIQQVPKKETVLSEIRQIQTTMPIKKHYYFENGKAYNANGTLFSGIITEKTKSNTFEIAYKDGLPQTSTKNGNLFKKWSYEQTDEIEPAIRIEIEEFNENQNIIKKTYHYIKDNLRRLIKADYKERTLDATDFSKEGYITRKTSYFPNIQPNSTFLNEEIDFQTEYDKAGNIIRKIEFRPFDKCDITKNGRTITGIYHGHSINYNKSDSLVDIEIPRQKGINNSIKNLLNKFRK